MTTRTLTYGLVVAIACTWRASAAAPQPAEPTKPAQTRPGLQQPLAYGKDLVEVRSDHTLGRRYRHWGDACAAERARLFPGREGKAVTQLRSRSGCGYDHL